MGGQLRQQLADTLGIDIGLIGKGEDWFGYGIHGPQYIKTLSP